jgi:hypothetical protein
MVKRRRTKGQTTIYKTLHSKVCQWLTVCKWVFSGCMCVYMCVSDGMHVCSGILYIVMKYITKMITKRQQNKHGDSKIESYSYDLDIVYCECYS